MSLNLSPEPTREEANNTGGEVEARYFPTQGSWYLPPRIPNASGSQTILMVEDNDDLRVVLQVFLEVVGYKVLPCADAEEASRVFGSGVAVDLLLTDVEMPGRSGFELASELTALRPSLPVVVVSGCFISAETQAEMHARKWPFLSKPYSFPGLMAKLHKLLGVPKDLSA